MNTRTAAGDASPSPAIIGILAALGALGTLATNILLPSLPDIARDFGVTTAGLGPMLSAFFASFALGQLIVGPLGDRFGRRAIVLVGLALFAAGSVWCAVSTTLPGMVSGRVVQGLGVCATSVLARAIARDLFEGATLSRVLSLMTVAMAAAPGFSPLLGGGLARLFGWRAAFVAVALCGAAVAIAYAHRVGETHRGARAPLDAKRVARSYAILASDGRFLGPAITIGLLTGSLFALFTAAPAILLDGIHLSRLGLGLFFASTVFVVFGAGLAAPRLSARLGAPRAVLLGLVIAFTGGTSLLLIAATGAISLPSFAITASLFLLGMGTANPLATALSLSPFGDRAGVASALLGFLQMAGAALGVALVTSLPLPPALGLGAVQATLMGATALLFLRFTVEPARSPA